MNYVIITLSLLFSITSISQTNNLEDGWIRVFVDEVGSFDIPPSMEIQDGVAKEINSEFERVLKLPSTNIVIQQKELNKDMDNVFSGDFDSENGAKGKGFERYARVMLSTMLNETSIKLFCESSPFNKSDLILGNTELKNQFSANITIVEWFPIEFVKINEMCGLHISYIRKSFNGIKANVKVDEYQFFNNDRIHQLILSYRVNEENIWKKDLKKILNSFTITNVR